jgi:serine/threonine protein kinase
VGQEQVLAGRYALLSPLGRGGMGQVWEALDTRLNRKVAVKLLTAPAFAAGPGPGPGARRFTREAAVTARLAHPGVPAIFDAGAYSGGLYLVMELVDGCTIGDLIAEQGPLPVGWAAGIADQVAAVLVIAHQREILHRDIKPQNVMLTRDGTAKVLDFGVAGIISQRGGRGQAIRSHLTALCFSPLALVQYQVTRFVSSHEFDSYRPDDGQINNI